MGLLSWLRPKTVSLPLEICVAMTNDERVLQILKQGVMLAAEFNAIYPTRYGRMKCLERLASQGHTVKTHVKPLYEGGKFQGSSISYSIICTTK